jgi:hypothetical protein
MKKGPTRLLGSGQVPVDEVLTSERRSALTRSMSIVVKLPRKGATTTVKHLMIHMLWHIYLLFNRQNTPIRKFTEQEREAAIASTDVNTLHNAVYVKTTPNQTDVTNRTLASAEAGQLFASVLSSAADVSDQGKIISQLLLPRNLITFLRVGQKNRVINLCCRNKNNHFSCCAFAEKGSCLVSGFFAARSLASYQETNSRLMTRTSILNGTRE